MINLFVLEDYTLGAQKQRDWETPGGVAPTAECMFMGQKYDLGVICVTHTLSGTSSIIRDNVETVILCSLPGENPRLICNTLGLNLEAAESVKTIRPGGFVILNPFLWDKCVYATFEKVNIPGELAEVIRRETVANFLKKIKAIASASLSVFSPDLHEEATNQKNILDSHQTKLPSEHIKVLVFIATGIPRPATKLCRQMNLSRTQYRRITKRLESIGAIAAHRFSTGRVGGQLCFYEITRYGWETLSAVGISKPKSRTNGGFEHELAAKLIEGKGSEKGFAVKFEVDIDGVRIDVVWIDRKNGQRIFINIAITNYTYEADAILRMSQLPILKDRPVLIVARDSVFAHKLKEALKAKSTQDNILNQIEIKLLADFVDM